ncbi:GDP dissociation inhibitor-domain-containing protein [Cantharellus anzutake]|uniref:GDP dissociation inhibitor-domain-containing protein n=1 Tax=Cantharellus anzutake TaxID=1750568 RepID=UPI001908F3D2|nr:GDP dissociation inhibitor-domain-containing protein [Cantharellus anzutake]KAF8334978.1 GDP dissociation inhibitor-domain-containing protein [Cantharellus anzutake]
MSSKPLGAFDVAIVGTGLSQSILAAALSKSGYKVLHLDPNQYYGSYHASLTLDELVMFSENYTPQQSSHPRYSEIQYDFPQTSEPSSELSKMSRHFSISLSPSLIPSKGAMIDSLIGSGVSRYGGFNLLQGIGMYVEEGETGYFRPVPASKEDIFKDKSMSRVEKLKLMKFLRYIVSDEGKLEPRDEITIKELISGDFGLPPFMASAVIYALAFSSSGNESSAAALSRIQHYMLSSGRYGNSPFLVGHYGGLGEVAQGFCRASAVYGGVYILGRQMESINFTEKGSPSSRYRICVNDVPDILEARTIVFPSSGIASVSSILSGLKPTVTEQETRLARCIAILDFQIVFEPANQPPADTFTIVFPPHMVGRHEKAVVALVTGEGTLSCPSGYYISYLVTEVEEDGVNRTAETILRPYLSSLLSKATTDASRQSPKEPLFELFYIEMSPTQSKFQPPPVQGAYLIDDSSPSVASFTECADHCAREAERVFWEVVKFVESDSGTETQERIAAPKAFWPISHLGDGSEAEGSEGF